MENLEKSENRRQLDCITIQELLARRYNFFIPDYQRGYRWGEKEILTLMKDLKEFCENHETGFYCLQPITLKQMTKDEIQNKKLDGGGTEPKEWFEVVDGQQRLTTIYLLITCAYDKDLIAPACRQPLYKLHYETREGSADFLEQIRTQTEELAKKNIDYDFMFKAYGYIKNWFEDHREIPDASKQSESPAQKVANLLCGTTSNVKVILYLADEKVCSETLFDNLNDGKILLSNSELIKALFLSKGSMRSVRDSDGKLISEGEQYSRQHHIALQWDIIEKTLGDKNFWSFVTNKEQSNYDTKIDILFETIYKGKDTFAAVENELEKHDVWYLWLEIERCYNILLEWYKDNNLYHFIGFLIAREDEKELGDLLLSAKSSSRKEFLDEILKAIQKKLPKNWPEAEQYTYKKNYEKIVDLLFFYNVEVTRRQNEQRFPFYHYKRQKYTLEHIHAQNAEAFDENKKEPLVKFLEEHIGLLRQQKELLLKNSGSENSSQITDLDNLINKCQELITNSANKSGQTIQETMDEVLVALSNTEKETGTSAAKDELSNLALLDQRTNTFLSASAFAFKRKKIIESDRRGDFIPICTKRVFLKYYAKPDGAGAYINQIFYWDQHDRNAYLQDIETVVAPYITMK